MFLKQVIMGTQPRNFTLIKNGKNKLLKQSVLILVFYEGKFTSLESLHIFKFSFYLLYSTLTYVKEDGLFTFLKP